MKKWIAMLLAVVMMMSLAACGGGNDKDDDKSKETEAVEVPGSALEILETVWNSYEENDKFFAMGGDYTNPVDNAPGEFSLAEPETVTAMLLVPAEQQANIDGAASLMHAMMPNNFTCGVYHVTGDAAAFADAMQKAVSENPWMCGMPEKMIIAVIGGEYVLVSFGINDTMRVFEEKLTGAYPKADLKYNEEITG